MNIRWLAAIPGLAALVCGGMMLHLRAQFNDTLLDQQGNSIAEFNFLQQLDHNFDTFAHVLTDYDNSEDSAERETLRDAYITRYDVLCNLLKSMAEEFPADHLYQASTAGLIADGNAFLQKYESTMLDTINPDRSTIRAIVAQARELSGRVFDMGFILSQSRSDERSEIAEQIDQRNATLLMLFIMFALTALLIASLLVALSKRTASISEKARNAESKLNNALDELNAGDMERQALNSFVAAASHDLRQPLHALGLYLGALKSHVTTEQGHSILDNSFRSTEALNHLLNSMLDLSKLDAGVVDVEMAHVPVNDMLSRLRQTFLPDAQERQLQLEVQTSDLVVHTDPVLFERILTNLVSNALNYTESGTVSITATRSADNVDICVTDTGQGIPIHEQALIFNEYYQLHNPERDRTKGLGLGLSIVKRLTRLLDIRLTLASEPGKGSQFTLSVPVGDRNRCPTPTREHASESLTDLDGLSILVIDDETDVRESMSTLLRLHRSEVVSVDSAETALNFVVDNEWVPDLIVADYRLRDEKKGDVAIRQVREEINEDVPAMIVTGDTSPARLREATASGFTLLHKPVIANELLTKITQLIGERA